MRKVNDSIPPQNAKQFKHFNKNAFPSLQEIFKQKFTLDLCNIHYVPNAIVASFFSEIILLQLEYKEQGGITLY